jgi:Protein of unknown function (DUF3311)
MTRNQHTASRLRYWPRLLFLIPFGAMMWVPSYNRTEPELGGIPFFYWYQLGWILLGAAIVLIVHLIETRITRATEPPGTGLEPEDVPGDIL